MNEQTIGWSTKTAPKIVTGGSVDLAPRVANCCSTVGVRSPTSSNARAREDATDLTGRLSNPREVVRSLPVQGSRRPGGSDQGPETADSEPVREPSAGARHRRGRLSNPVQRRLTANELDDLAAKYRAGSTIEVIAQEFGLHRTTVMDHLERRGIPRRTSRKLTDDRVNLAVRRYLNGDTLADIAERLHVSPSTLTRELRRAGIPIRRRGRPGKSPG